MDEISSWNKKPQINIQVLNFENGKILKYFIANTMSRIASIKQYKISGKSI